MDEVVMQSSIREEYCYSTKFFIRDRILTLKCTVMLIINALKRSLSIELQGFFEQFSNGIRCSKQAFCEQRVKLKPIFFQAMNERFVEKFYHYYGEQVSRWKGMIIWAIDGSSVPLPRTEDLMKAYERYEW